MISVEDLVVDFGAHRALFGISFEVREGDVFGFIGPNGAGKSTTMRVLATLLEPTGGKARIRGLDVVEEPEKARAMTGYMPDVYGVYDGLSVREYLDFFAAAFGVRQPRRARSVADVMDLTDLSELADRQVSHLSRGMQQRLCVAKTLVHDPAVLILDEPASGLDPRARIEFRALLRELKGMGKTILISSHILTELSDVCTRIGVIEAGRIVAAGTVSEIFTRLTPFTQVMVTVPATSSEAVKVALETPGVARASSEGGRVLVEFEGRDPDVPELVRRLVGRGVPVSGVQKVEADLEDLFMKITEGKVQ